jgi:hypothetical protein
VFPAQEPIMHPGLNIVLAMKYQCPVSILICLCVAQSPEQICDRRKVDKWGFII